MFIIILYWFIYNEVEWQSSSKFAVDVSDNELV